MTPDSFHRTLDAALEQQRGEALTAAERDALDESLADSGCHGFMGDHEPLYAAAGRILAARLAEARAEERERAAWEVQRVINHWSSVPADVLAERAAELADLQACRDRIARSEAGA